MRNGEIHEEEHLKRLNGIIERISNGEIVCWSQFRIYSDLIDCEIDRKSVRYMFYLYQYKNLYPFLEEVMKDDDFVNEFVDNELIDMILKTDKHMIFDYNGNGNNKKFNGIDMLKKMDIKNPFKMLRYFLKHDYDMNQTSTIEMLETIIKRTELRATKNQSFGKFLEPLEEKKKDVMRSNIFNY